MDKEELCMCGGGSTFTWKELPYFKKHLTEQPGSSVTIIITYWSPSMMLPLFSPAHFASVINTEWFSFLSVWLQVFCWFMHLIYLEQVGQRASACSHVTEVCVRVFILTGQIYVTNIWLHSLFQLLLRHVQCYKCVACMQFKYEAYLLVTFIVLH